MQFIDLKAQYRRIQNSIDKRISQVLERGQFINGPEITELEAKLSEYVGAKHCIGVASGTDAILVALMALGIGPGDEVITTPFSFIATASMIKLLGAKPVFVDIDPKTYNIDASKIEQAITANTKAILPVNLYGQCADFDAINALAEKFNLSVIEDAAQSFGAEYKGRRSGNLSRVACTSFYPSKPLGAYGDGGACFTNDDELALKIRRIKNHGQDRSYHHICMGINGRLDTLQAAVLLAKLEIFPQELERRAQICRKFDQLLAQHVAVPYIEPHNRSTYAQYTIQVNNRDAVVKALTQKQIPTAIHYPAPIHLQPLFASEALTHSYPLPCSELMAKTVLSLPFHPYLQDEEIENIAKVLIAQVTSGEEVLSLCG